VMSDLPILERVQANITIAEVLELARKVDKFRQKSDELLILSDDLSKKLDMAIGLLNISQRAELLAAFATLTPNTER